jgi:hypothetical protein
VEGETLFCLSMILSGELASGGIGIQFSFLIAPGLAGRIGCSKLCGNSSICMLPMTMECLRSSWPVTTEDMREDQRKARTNFLDLAFCP